MNTNSVNKIILIFNAVLFIALIVLYILFFSSRGSGVNDIKKTKSNDSTLTTLSIAYINLDSLLLQYQMSIDLNENLLTEHAKSKANLERQVKQFEKDYNAFMEKARLGTFLSQASMEAQQNDLVQKQQKLQALDEQLTQELLDKQTEMNKQLFDTVMNYIKEFNDGKYSLILGNSSGAIVLYGEEGMNITKEVVTNLNERYAKSKK